MCFGDSESTETKNSTQSSVTNNTMTATANPQVQGISQANLERVNALQGGGFTPYGGQRVADFTGLQNTAFQNAAQLGPNQYLPQIQGYFNQYGGGPAQSVNAERIHQNMSPYMNQYVMESLIPQIAQQDLQFAKQNQAREAGATMAGAFGDARAGIEASNDKLNQNLARQGLIGQAYNQAFNTAIQAGGQDASNNLQAQQATGQFAEQALARALGAGSALQGLDQSEQARAMQQGQYQQQMGALQQENQQQRLNAGYSDYLMAQQFPFLAAQLMNQTLGTAAKVTPATVQQSGTSYGTGTSTATSSSPDNSGWGLAGSIAGALMFSDERVKENIEPVGKTFDGQNLYKFNYKGSKVPQVGLMAQEVEQRMPEAVVEIGGVKAVNYDMATALSRALGAMAA